METFPLTVVDQYALVTYTRLVYGFRFLDTDKIPAAVNYLLKGLHRVLKRWPFLAGQVVHPADSTTAQVVYSEDLNNFNINVFPYEVFCHEVLTKKKFPYTCVQLLDLGIPPALMEQDIFSLSLSLSPGESCHPLALKASFIEGGLLLCIASHYTVCDGICLLQVLETNPGDPKLPVTSETGSCINLKKDFNSRAIPPPQSIPSTSHPHGLQLPPSKPVAPSSPDHQPQTPSNIAQIATAALQNPLQHPIHHRQHLQRSQHHPSLSKDLATLSSTPPHDLAIAHQSTVQQSTTGLESSSWSFLGADVRFGILGTVNSRPDWARKKWSANDGSMNILPRRQGNERQAGTEEQEGKWEVLLALNEGGMTFVCNELRAIGLLKSTTFGWRHKAK